MSKNKVEEQDIIDQIDRVEYSILPDSTTTICQIHLKNGWMEIGHSACVDPANFDKEVGEHWAYKNAFNKLWPLFGFLLRQHIHVHGTTAKSRAIAERDDYLDKLSRLNPFIESQAFHSLAEETQTDLRLQKDLMTQLAFLISKRIDEWAE